MRIGITERGDGGINQSWRNQMKNVDGAIIITKAPQLLIDTDIPNNIIIHCTITGWGGTIIEPGVEKPSITIPAWKQLKEQLDDSRVVLRIDPIIASHPKPAFNVLKMANPSPTDRIRISFMDAYPHVRTRFENAKLELDQPQFHADLATRKNITEAFPPHTEICGEPGFKCKGCISTRDLNTMKITTTSTGKCTQRRECMCISEKTELLNNRGQCKHGCLYCYWK